MTPPPTNEDLGERHDSWLVMIGGTIAVFLTLVIIVPRLLKIAASPLQDKAQEHLLLQSASRLKKVENHLIAFEQAFGRYPGGYRGIEMLIWDSTRGDAPTWATTQRMMLSDAWSRPLLYKAPSADGEHPFELICLGRDGLPGGEGPDRDISNWDWPSRIEAPWPEPTSTPTP